MAALHVSENKLYLISIPNFSLSFLGLYNHLEWCKIFALSN